MTIIDLSPDEFRALGYRAIDLLAQQLAHLQDAPASSNFTRKRPIWTFCLMFWQMPGEPHN